ncbi:MAG: hypothetical protein ACOY3P_06680 [Planctomycetota bacterium]
MLVALKGHHPARRAGTVLAFQADGVCGGISTQAVGLGYAVLALRAAVPIA